MYRQSTLSSSQDSVLQPAVEWIEAVVFGSVGTTIAVIAVAFLGFGMLAGRLDARRALQMILGTFIFFGATAIARELMSLARTEEQATPLVDKPYSVSPPPVVPKNAREADPYAGAAIPPD